VGRSQAADRGEVRQVNYSLDIRPDALADIENAAQWYEDQEPTLGADFARVILDAIQTIPANPLMHRLRDRQRNVRWLLAPRFPYRIAYRVRDELITVFAVIHVARHDRHWKKRI
jgi:plasmid stabilization system protein ParE